MFIHRIKVRGELVVMLSLYRFVGSTNLQKRLPGTEVFMRTRIRAITSGHDKRLVGILALHIKISLAI